MNGERFKKGTKSEMIEIASTTDSEFTDVLLTSYVSLLENNSADKFRFNVIDDELTDTDKKRLSSLKQIYPNCQEVIFLGNDFAGAYQGANVVSPRSLIKENTYYRFEFPKLVDRPRLLYLDCDMICCGDISTLFHSELHDNIIGAVESQMYVDRLNILGVKHQFPLYFNAGLLLIDTKKWNEHQITAQAQKYMRDHSDIIAFQDQDTLNAVLADWWEPLDPKYNVQSPLMRHEKQSLDLKQRQAATEALKDPTLTHYTGFSKPWVTKGEYVSPWRDEYYKYQKIMFEKVGRR